MFICVIGTSHHSAPLALRERLSYSNDSRAAARRADVGAVQGIVGEEVESFSRWLQSLNVTPTIRALRELFALDEEPDAA